MAAYVYTHTHTHTRARIITYNVYLYAHTYTQHIHICVYGDTRYVFIIILCNKVLVHDCSVSFFSLPRIISFYDDPYRTLFRVYCYYMPYIATHIYMYIMHNLYAHGFYFISISCDSRVSRRLSCNV